MTQNGHISLRRRLAAALSASAVERFWRQTLLLLVAVGLLNGSNYVFHVVISRLLGPSRYGALASLLAVVLVLSVPFGVLQTVIAQKAAALRARGAEDEIGELAAGAVKTLIPLALLAGFAVLLGSPLLALFLQIGLGPSALLAPYVTISILGSVPLGILQGQHRFAGIASVMLVGVALRLAIGVGLVAAGGGVAGAMVATPLAAAATLPLGLRLAGVTRRSIARARRSLARLRGDFAAATLGLTSFWIFAELDLALARHYLDHTSAGYYSSAGLLARGLLFLPAAVSIVAFPRFVMARERGVDHERWLRLSLAGVIVLAAPTLLVLTVLRRPLVEAAFGGSYASAADLVLILAPAMALMALVNVLVYFHVAMRSRAYVLLLIASAGEAIAIGAAHGSAHAIAVTVAATSALAAFAMYRTALSLCRWHPPLQSGERLGASALAQTPTVELSLVVPCHNAGAGLAAFLRALLDELDGLESFEVIVVSDGSSDDTAQVARSTGSDRVRVIEYPQRGGKGNALHVGLTDARGEYIAFVDGDGDIAPTAIRSFLALMKLYEPDVILGSKRHPLSEVYYPPLRRLLSWTYHKIARLMFRVNVRDTQTGLKLIRRDVLRAVMPRLLEKRYAFDLEFLVVARSLGFKRVLEAPVRIEYRFGSQVNAGAALRIGLDTLAIFYRHYILDTYRQSGRHVALEPFAPGAPLSDPHVIAEPPRMLRMGSGRSRILFLNWRDVRNPASGGAEVFTHEVTRRWVELGYDVTLLTSGFRGAPEHETVDGVTVRRMGTLRSGSFHLLVQRELLRLHAFDGVVDAINTIPFLTPLWRRRLPPTIALVFQLAVEVWDYELPKPLSTVGRWLEPRLLRPYRDFPVVTISQSGREELERLGFVDVKVVEPGLGSPPKLVDVEKEREPTFLFSGRLTPNKRPDHALEAFRRIADALPDAKLWITGRGPMEANLVKQLPGGVELLGYVPRAELYERMARAHCLLVPSVREGWGLVVVEAGSVGTPAVGYDVAGIRDSIQDGRTGLLARSGDSAALAQRALELVQDVDRYERFASEAAAWSRGFSWDATAAELLAVLQGAVAPTSPRARDLSVAASNAE